MSSVWMRQLDVPVLALTAGDERVVDKPSTIRMLPCLPSCEVQEIAGAKHELLQENPAITTRIWGLVDRFLDALPG
jgi:alpha-beta hydrolase superfamily lysophospholipase